MVSPVRSTSLLAAVWIGVWIVVAPIVVAPIASTAEENASPPAWIDLLKVVDPQANAVVGDWQIDGGELKVDAVNGARLVVTYDPPDEYDLEVTFTRTSGSNSVALIFVAGGNQASIDIDAWGQHLGGIQNVDGQTIRDNPTRVNDLLLENGRQYTLEARVRKDRVEVVLDGKQIFSHRTDGSDLSMLELWRLPDTKSFGLAAWNSATTFHRVRVRSASSNKTASSSKTAGSNKPAGSELASDASRSVGSVFAFPARPTGQAMSGRSRPNSIVTDDLDSLSDEFDDSGTIDRWLRVYRVEKSSADQLERFDVGRSTPGWMTMTPYTSSWFRDWRGVLVHKRVRGDFVVTTRVRATGRSGNRPPNRQYSLAGIMVRAPRAVTPQTWRPGGENYIFLSFGTADRPGNYQFEVKTTINSNSTLEINNADASEALIRVARMGPHFILLRKPVSGGQWRVHRRYHRPDLPDELQIGMTVYTDWQGMQSIPPERHNQTVLRNGNPDLVARFDYFRFRRPTLPEESRQRAFSNPREVPDNELLRLLSTSDER